MAQWKFHLQDIFLNDCEDKQGYLHCKTHPKVDCFSQNCQSKRGTIFEQIITNSGKMLTILCSTPASGTGATKTDEFSEKLQTAFGPPPPPPLIFGFFVLFNFMLKKPSFKVRKFIRFGGVTRPSTMTNV